MSGRDPFSTYRARLEALGFHPSRQLGQNFLLQPELHRAIADAGRIDAGDVVLEIGAGLGFLTRELAERARQVIAVEIDDRLVTILNEERPRWPHGERVQLLHADVLQRGRLAPVVGAALAAAGAPWRVVANLPYAVTGPVLVALCVEVDPLPAGGSILIQAEAAERFTAAPATATWGSLSALVQACFTLRVARKVGAEVFRPRPNVDSAILELTRRPAGGLTSAPAAERRRFAAFVRALFSGRRKKARHSIDAALQAAGLAAASPVEHPLLASRPAELRVDDLLELWQSVRQQS